MKNSNRSQRSTALRILALAALAHVGAPAFAQQPPQPDKELRLKLVAARSTGALALESFQRLLETIEATPERGPLAIALPFELPAEFEGFELPSVRVKLDRQRRSFALTGAFVREGAAVELAFAGVWTDSARPGRFVLALKPEKLALGAWIPALSTTPLADVDLSLPVFAFADAPWSSLEPLGDAGAWFAARDVDLTKGWNLRGQCDAARLPAALRSALGLADRGSIVLEGSLEADLSLAARAANIRAFELRAVLPAEGSIAPWLSAAKLGVRELRVQFRSPSELSCTAGQAIEIDGRALRLEVDLLASSSAARSGIQARITGEWPAPFGLAWLALRDVTLRASDSSDSGVLEGRFDVAGREGRVSIELSAARPERVRAQLDRVALADLVSSGVVDELPAALRGPLESLIGHADLELAPAAVTVELKQPPTLAVSATVVLREMQTEFLYVRELRAPSLGGGASSSDSTDDSNARGASGAGGGLAFGSFFAFQPRGASLGKLFPELGRVPALSELAGAEIGIPTLFSGRGQLDFELPGGWLDGLRRERGADAPDAEREDDDESSAGGGRFRIGSLELPTGWRLRGRIPRATLPSTRGFGRVLARLESSLGLTLESLELDGSFGLTLADTRLGLRLPVPTASGASAGWLRAGALDLKLDGSGALAIGGRLEVQLDEQPVAFRVATRLDLSREAFELSAKADGTWRNPRGIQGLELRDLALALAVDAAGAKVTCSASLPIGARTASVSVELNAPATGGADEPGTAALNARLDELALSDLTALFGAPAPARNGLDGALVLKEVELAFLAGRNFKVVASARAELFGRVVDTLACIERQTGRAPLTAIAVQLPDLDLAQFAPELRGTPAALRFPSSTLTFGSGWTEGTFAMPAVTRPSGAAKPPQLEVSVRPGLQLRAELPLGNLPPAVRRSLGVEGADASLLLDGELVAELSGAAPRISGFTLRAVLPRAAGLEPRGWPKWIQPVEAGERTLLVSYTAPSRIALISTREVTLDLAGERRSFRLEAQAQAGDQTANARFEASLAAPWKAPFGIGWLELKHASVSGELAEAAVLALDGEFEAAGHRGQLHAEFRPAASGKAASGRIEARFDQLELAELTRLLHLEALPVDAFEGLQTGAFALRDLRVGVELGGERSLSIGARVAIRGGEADFKLVHSRSRGAATGPWIVMRPAELSLGSIVPRLDVSGALGELAALRLDGLLVFPPRGRSSVTDDDVPEELDAYLPPKRLGLPRMNFSPGLNLAAPFDLSSLPRDGMVALTLARIGPTLGIDLSRLHLQGSIGRTPAELGLRIALPPIDPKLAPAWLQSGQLALAFTGRASFSVDGRLQLDIDGEQLAFLVTASVSRVGAAPAIKLHGAFETERPWVSPFGMRGLELERVALGIALDATGSVSPSFAAKLKVGRKDLDVAAMVRISPAGVPIGGMFYGASEEGFALSDLAELQRKLAAAAGGRTPVVPLDKLPDIALRGIELKLAPRDVPEDHVERGVTLRGELFVPAQPRGPAVRRIASIDGDVGDEGIRLSGELAPLRFGALTLEQGRVELVAASGDQSLKFDGAAVVLGRKQALSLLIGRERMSCAAQVDLAGRWQQSVQLEATYDLESPDFQAIGELASAALTELSGELRTRAAARIEGVQRATESARQLAEQVGRQADERRRALQDLRTSLERAVAAAKAHLATSRTDMQRAKAACDAAHKLYADTPDDRPVLKEARRKAWQLAQAAYEIGSNSKKAICEARQAALDALPQPESAPKVVELAEALTQLTQRAGEARAQFEQLDAVVQEIRRYREQHPGAPLLSLESAAFGTSLAQMARGGDIPLDASVRWLGQIVRIDVTLHPREPLAVARQILESLLPEAS